jgi:fimbrial isopeptide formation D2 family protein/uncharacterized repeat protein (TIGR01451 family)
VSRTRLFIRGTHGLRSKLTAGLSATALIAGLLTAGVAFGAASPAAAAPGDPGTPSDPVVLFEEDFQNRPAGSNVLLTDYEGATGMTYSGDPVWVDRALCDGFIIDHGSARLPGDCNGPSGAESTGEGVFNTLAALPYALGMLAGDAAPETNAAAASFTSGDTADNAVQFRTEQALSLPTENRFVTFSVDAVAVNCQATHPELRFYLENAEGDEIPVSSTAIDPCDDPRSSTVQAPRQDGTLVSASGGTFAADSSLLVTGGTLGVVMRNENPSGGGNDGAYDNIRVLDVTPQLDKSFSPTSVYVDGSSTLTFTVTNTSELAAKDGWSFTDQLPDGLTIAAQPNVGGTCDAMITAPAGGTSVAVAAGSLAAGEASCTITVDVTSAAAGTFTNGPDNVETVGLNEPAESTVEFLEQSPFACVSNAPGLLFQGIPASMSSVDLVTGEYESDDAIFPRNINATGYNVLDGYIYGYTTTTEPFEMVRVGPDGAVQSLGPIPGVAGAFHIGDVDLDGHYWLSNGTTWYEVDLVPDSPTYRTVLDSGPVTGLAAGVTGGADWAYVPGGGDYLYGVFTGADGNGVLYGFNMVTEEYESFGSLGVPISPVGAVYADADGFLYSSSNADGRIFRIDVADVTATLFAQGPGSAQNDGARCATSPILLDFGDAPDSYGTTLAADGPRHGIQGMLVGGSAAPLMLGGSVDAETDGVPSDAAEAAGDDDGVPEPIVVTVGEETVVTVSATNDTDEAATLAGWIDLDGSGTFDAGELVTAEVPAGSGTADYQLTFPAGTTTEDTFARFRLFAADVTDFLPTGGVAAGEVEDYSVSVIERDLAIEKTSTITDETRAGDTVTYTVTATNTGTAPYTEDDPAVVFDDLSGVLDDATFNDDAEAAASDGSDVPAPAFLEPAHISWTGSLAAGESVEITYTVTLTGAGDGVVENVAWAPTTPPPPGEVPPTPACDPATAEGTDPVTGEACGRTESELPRLSVAKSSDVTELPADGDVVTYEVTVTNEGPGAYTEDAPASMTDDLSEVLDDAEFGGFVGPDTGAVFDEDAQELTWSGPLAAGESVTIRYTVTYDQNAGDNVLLNRACIPAEQGAPGAEPCAEVRVPAAEIDVTKTVDPEDGTAVTAGQEVTYTISFESVGQIPGSVEKVDDLSGVLDDATLVEGSIVTSNPALTATLDGDRLVISGEVPNGETYTVSYTVIVDAYADQADHVLGNVVTDPDGDCGTDECPTTENPIRHLSVEKSATPAEGVLPGDVVEYTVTVTSDGEGDYTAEVPAAVSDDMTDVLDDAAYNGDVSAVSSDGSVVPAPVFDGGVLGWSGPLAAGETVTITYSVTVTNLGDNDLVNTAAVVCGEGEICDPPVPPVEILLPRITPGKASDPGSGADVAAGDVITYTLTWTNDGKAAGPVDSTDDLSGVLDDAELTALPVVDDAHAETVEAVFVADEQTIRVIGDLPVGETVTVTYQVTVLPDAERGDNVVDNVLTADAPPFVTDPDCEGADCPPPFGSPSTEHRIAEIVDSKSVDPSSSVSVQPGQELTYTLRFENIGSATGTVDRVDDLTHVLDDADVTVVPTVTGAALAVSEITDGRFAVTGELEAGQSATVTYTVTVRAADRLGDGQLANFLLDPGTPSPAEPVCEDGEDCTFNPVSDVTVTKTADPEDGTEVEQGQDVTYTLTFANAGRGSQAIDYTDHMAEVLDDADLTQAPTASDETLTVSELADEAFSVAGELAAGQTVTVSYTVTVRAYGAQGDHALGNVVAVTGQEASAECAEDNPLCTRHPVAEPAAAEPPLAATGGDIATVVLLSALGLLVLGGGVFLIARRRRESAHTGGDEV